MALEHLQSFSQNSNRDADPGSSMLKYLFTQDIVILNICVKLYQN